MIRQMGERPSLLALGLASLLGYGLMAVWFPLLAHVDSAPAKDLRSFAPSLLDGLAYAALLGLLFGLYLWACRLVSRRPLGLDLRLILLVGAVCALPLLFAYPINATDVFRYFIRGRVAVVHQADPFSVPVSDVANEPYAPLAGEWATATSPYGPVWELAAGRVVSLAPDNLGLALLLFKALAVAAFLASAILIWRSTAAAGVARQSALTALWAWNPALLLSFAANGHNDALMILWLLLGWWLLARGRAQLGLAAMLLSPLTKPIGLLAVPYFFLAAWRQTPRAGERWRLLLGTAAAGLLLAWLAFAPFGPPLTLARRLLSESGTGGGFSLLAAFILLARELGGNPPVDASVTVATALFGLLALGLLWRTWRGRSALRAAADVFAGYVMQAFRFRIWYAAWPFPWLVLDQARSDPSGRSRARLAAGLTFLLTSQLSVIIHGQVRVALLNGSSLAAHLIGVPFTFLLPLLVGAAVFYGHSHDPRKGR